jgi:hypothetical protein
VRLRAHRHRPTRPSSTAGPDKRGSEIDIAGHDVEALGDLARDRTSTPRCRTVASSVNRLVADRPNHGFSIWKMPIRALAPGLIA